MSSSITPMERCYLAGPMRGYPEYNFPAFFAAAKTLRARGYEVWSPAENDVHADGFDPAKDTAQPMRHYMKRDLPAVLDADFLAVLPGWEKSQGASLEVHIARTCGIPVWDAITLATIKAPLSETVESQQRITELEVRLGNMQAALLRVVRAEERFVKDTGISLNDAISDAVDAAKALLPAPHIQAGVDFITDTKLGGS